MAIFGALGTARSGLVATGAALSVIGNNIANVNTIGFKGSRTDFSDLLSAQGGGGSAIRTQHRHQALLAGEGFVV